MISNTYIISQILAVINYILFWITYYIKKRQTILLLGFIAVISHALSYLLLDGFTGAMMGIVATFRNGIFLYREKKNKDTKTALLYILYFITIIFTIITYKNIFSILPMMATILYTYPIWQKDVHKYKLLAIIIGILYFIYNIYLKSIADILLEFITFACVLIGYTKDIKKRC